jgi:hypothetical protein
MAYQTEQNVLRSINNVRAAVASLNSQTVMLTATVNIWLLVIAVLLRALVASEAVPAPVTEPVSVKMASLAPEAAAAVVEQPAPAIVYHPLDRNTQTFTPMPNMICIWVAVKTVDGAGIIRSDSQPEIVNRISGLSCVYVSDVDFDSYLDRFPR